MAHRPGATVILETDESSRKDHRCRKWLSCQMEPVAHYGLRKIAVIRSVSVRWTDGTEDELGEVTENTVHTIRKDE